MNILTSRTLLESLQHRNDQEAWSRFYELYSPIIFGIACKFGFDRATAEDILQETMCNLVVSMPKFKYRKSAGRFSTYLYVIVRSIISKRTKIRKISTVPLNVTIEDAEHRSHGSGPYNFFDDLEQKRKDNLKRIALSRVKERIELLTWKSFKSFVLIGNKSADEVASELGIKDRNVIYQHKNRVVSLLKEEIRKLEQEVGDFDDSWTKDKEEFDDLTLQTLTYDLEIPSEDVEKRVRIIQKALSNQNPESIKENKLLVITSGNNWWEELTKDFYVGKDEMNNLHLNSKFLSRKHCMIFNDSHDWRIKDLHSKNGTSVNGKSISEKVLNDGDIIQLGDVLLLFVNGKENSSIPNEKLISNSHR